MFALTVLLLVTGLIVWKTFSTPQYEFLNPKATKSLAQCTEAALDPGDECYYIPHLNYIETVTWHQNKLSTLGWEGGSSNDFVPFSFFYQKDDEKIQLIFYPANTTTEGNITTIHYDKAGVGVLIKNINLSD
jgi:hypothetical protein